MAVQYQYENERMSALITQFLELAKTESTVPAMDNVDLSRLVYGEVLPFETMAYEQGADINSQLEEGHFCKRQQPAAKTACLHFNRQRPASQ